MTTITTEKINTLCDFYRNTTFTQFRSCQAWISTTIFNSAYNVTFQLVKSYDTIVGFINLDTKEYIELGKWSRTTSKQVTQIYNAFYSDFKRMLIS